MTRKAWRFFHENAGGIVGQAAIGAAALARAEEAVLADEYFVYEWCWDESPDLSWMSEREKSEPHEVLGCVLYRVETCDLGVEHNRCVASLWGIVNPDANYRRVIEAELALEATS